MTCASDILVQSDILSSLPYQVYNQSRIVLRYVGHPEHRARDRNTSIGEWSLIQFYT